jgi:hypothetical protein
MGFQKSKLEKMEIVVFKKKADFPVKRNQLYSTIIKTNFTSYAFPFLGFLSVSTKLIIIISFSPKVAPKVIPSFKSA